MNSPAEAPTLRDDWQERRALLARAADGSEFADVQLRVLDFLLKRYGDSPQADRPAQFPLPSAVYINQRAVLVHHHLGKHLASGVKSPRQAEERMTAILQRMVAPPPASDAAASAAIARQQAAEIEASVVAPFAGESRELQEARRLRFLLADPSTSVRMLTIFEIGETGTLDDVGLLMDLLALPERPDEARGERQMLLGAIEKISGVRPRGKEGHCKPPDVWFSEDPSASEASPKAKRASRLELPRPARADWTGLDKLLWPGNVVTIGVAVVATVIAGLLYRQRSPTTIYGSAALLAVYGLGVSAALYLWERTRRRRGW